MKKMILLVGLLFSGVASADTYVSGYTRSNGTYVQPHYRTDANSSINDNYSTRPNVNPYNGNVGTRQPSYGSYNSPSLGMNDTGSTCSDDGKPIDCN
jgi:hypothetical protein